MSNTTYYIVSWVDPQRRERTPFPRTREYGTETSKQAAIRLAERALPPDADYLIATLDRTVHYGRTAATRRRVQ